MPAVPKKNPPESKLYRYRSAVSGRIVSAWYAITHPRTTIRERRAK